MTEKRPLGWALIGASNIAREYMIPAIMKDKGSRIVALLSASAERGRRFAAAQGIPRSYDTIEGILADPEVDIVYISTTNELHKPQTLAAARAGKHVLCEKPLAIRVEDAIEMVDVCRAAGVTFGTNHHFRNAAWHKKLRELISNGAIGRPLAARVYKTAYLPEKLQGWRINRTDAGAGVILDLTVHDADTLRFVLNQEVEEVMAISVQQGMAQGEIEDAVMGVMRFGDDLLASFHDAYTLRHAGTRFEVHGTDGSLVAHDAMIEELKAEVTLTQDGKTEPVALGQREDLYIPGVRGFSEAVRGRGEPVATGEDGLRSLEVAVAVQESARSGRRAKVRHHVFNGPAEHPLSRPTDQ